MLGGGKEGLEKEGAGGKREEGEEGEKVVEMQVMVVGGGGGRVGVEDANKAGEGEGVEVGEKDKKEEEGDVQMTEGAEGKEKGGDDSGGASVAQGVSGEEVLASEAFWDDLRGWLMQRTRDEGTAGEVWGVFKRGWDERMV